MAFAAFINRPGTVSQEDVETAVAAVVPGQLDIKLPSAVVTASGTTTARTLADRFADTVNVLDIIPSSYHAAIKGYTSTQDVVEYLEDAQEVGRSIFLPRGRYYISRPIRNISNRVWTGQGDSTVIYNPQTNSTSALRAGFMLGNMHPAAIKYSSPAVGQFPSYNISNVAAYDVTVTCSNAGDEDNFTVGQFVWVRSTAEASITDGNLGHYMQLTKVASINTTAHTITVADPILEAITGACISPIGDVVDSFMGYEWEVVENVVIRDMAISARSPVSTRTGAYRCLIENVSVQDATILFAANAFTKSRIKGLRGPWLSRGLEFKMCSQDFLVEDVFGHSAGQSDTLAALEIAEQSNRGTFRHVDLSIGSGASGSGAFGLSINGWGITVEDSNIANLAAYVGNPVAYLRSNDYTYPAKDIALRRVDLRSNANRTYHVRVGDSSTTATIDDVELNIRGYGSTSSGKSVRWERNVRGSMADCRLPSDVEVNSTGQRPLEANTVVTSRTKFPSVIAGSGHPESSVSAPSGTIYQRLDVDTAATGIFVKGGGYSSTGWQPLVVMTGVATNGNNNVSLTTASVRHQRFTSSLTANRSVFLPSFNANEDGQGFEIYKETTSGVGDLLIELPSSAGTLATIPAAEKRKATVTWTGSTYFVSDWSTLP